jgi:glycosyltransferase 2 family protein
MTKHSKMPISSDTKKRVVVLVLIVVFLYVVVPRLDSFSASFAIVKQAKVGYLGLAIGAVAITYLMAAGIYKSLALHYLRYGNTLLIQMASGFANRLLPAGLGTLTLYVQYLRKQKHTTAQAVTVSGLNNILGIVGHGLILLVALLTAKEAYPAQISLPNPSVLWSIFGGVILFVVANLLVFSKLREYAYRISKDVVSYLGHYRRQPQRLLTAVGLSLGLTICYVAIFYCCVVAVGGAIALQQLFLVFTIGMIVGTATPTPGGLIGAEAGLTGGLIAYGVQPETALAAALLYRFLTYWLPLVPGMVAFIKARKLYG